MPGASIDLHSHAHHSLMLAVRMKSHFRGQDNGIQLVLHSQISIGIAHKNLLALTIPEPHPLVQPGPEVLDHVVLRELSALAIAEPSLGLGGREGVHLAEVNLQVLLALFTHQGFWTPSAAILIDPDPESQRKRIV